MSSQLTNNGKNALIDALANGRNIAIGQGAVGSGDSDPSASNEELDGELEQYGTSNQRRATGVGRFDFTIPETSNVDGETLRQAGLYTDENGGSVLFGLIRFADTVKEPGQRLEFEVSVEVDNP